jgi:hypothetical protein
MTKIILIHILCEYSIWYCIFLHFDKTWLWYNCRLAILSIDYNAVKVTGLILGYLANKKSERKGSKWKVSSCTVQGHMMK